MALGCGGAEATKSGVTRALVGMVTKGIHRYLTQDIRKEYLHTKVILYESSEVAHTLGGAAHTSLSQKLMMGASLL